MQCLSSTAITQFYGFRLRDIKHVAFMSLVINKGISTRKQVLGEQNINAVHENKKITGGSANLISLTVKM